MRKLSEYASFVSEKISCSKLNKNTYVGMDNMLPDKAGITESEYVPKEGMATAFRKGDILLGNIRPYFKKIWLAEFDGGCSPDVLCLRCNDGVSPEYIFSVLAQDAFFEYDVKGAKGSKMPRGDKNHIMAFPITEIQSPEKAGELICSIHQKIQTNNAIISELESMAKDIYDYWFVQFDFPDENGKPYKASGGKMVWNDEIKREIPEGWKPAKIGDLATIKRGISYSASSLVADGLPMINLNSFTPSATYKTSGIKYYKGEVKEGGQVDAYDLLMCTTQQTDIDGKTDIIGKTMLIPDLFDSRMVFSMDLVKIQTDELLKTVIVSETKTPWYNKYITGFATGTSILHLKLDGFLSYQIPLPKDTAILKRFNSMYMEWERRKSIAMKENEELTALRDWLLPMLMNGQVKVGGVA